MTDTPNPVDQHVGARIRARRKQMDVNQEKLAGALGLTFQQIQKYERGTNRVSASKLFAVARFLDVPIGWFFDGLSDQSTDDPGEPLVFALVHTHRGAEIARVFPTLSTTAQQILVDLARNLAGETGRGDDAL